MWSEFESVLLSERRVVLYPAVVEIAERDDAVHVQQVLVGATGFGSAQEFVSVDRTEALWKPNVRRRILEEPALPSFRVTEPFDH